MPVKKTVSAPRRNTMSSRVEMPTMMPPAPPVFSASTNSSMPEEKHGCCHGHGQFGMGHHGNCHGFHFAHKLMKTFFGILLVYLIIFVGSLIRNDIKKYDFIGVAPADINNHQLNISAEGSIDVKPNISKITVGNSLVELTSQDASNKNNQLIADFVAKTKALGIDSADIKTESPSMYPEYKYTDGGERILVGYNINQSVTVKVRDDVDKASKVVALAGEVGLNTIGGIESVVDDDTEVYLEQARQEAVNKAKSKATELANMLGVELDGVISYSEYVPDGSYPMYAKTMDSATGMGGGPTIEPGTTQVKIDVNVTYKIK